MRRQRTQEAHSIATKQFVGSHGYIPDSIYFKVDLYDYNPRVVRLAKRSVQLVKGATSSTPSYFAETLL